MAEAPLFPGLEHDPNEQGGFDSMGNPVNKWGLPLGQRPSFNDQGGRVGDPTHTGGTGGYYGPGEYGNGNADMGFGQAFMGENPFRPGQVQVTSPGMTASTMTAAQMQAAGMDTGQADLDRDLGLQSRGAQGQLGQALMDRAMGKAGPSVAELQMQRGVGMAQQAAARQAASARGIGRGLASYGAMNAQANMASQGVQDASALRAQETIAAQQAAGKVFTDQRMQDLTSRGMSIQQAQAIMDAENRAREVNVGAENAARGANQGAINDARKTSLQAGLSAAQGNQQADSAQQGMMTQITEGEAARGQKAIGGGIPIIGGLLGSISDINAKRDVQPLLYSQPMMGLNTPEAPSREEVGDASKNLADAKRESDLQKGLRNLGNTVGMYGTGGMGANPQRVPQYTPPPGLGEAEDPYGGYTYEPPATGGDKKSGEGIAALGGMLAMISDKRAKTDAFIAGVKAASTPVPVPASAGMQKARIAQAPAADMSPERVTRMGRHVFHEALDQRDDPRRQELAKALQFLNEMKTMAPEIRNQPPEPPYAPPAPVPTTQLQPNATSDKKAKNLESENDMLKQALTQMGDSASKTPTASYPTPEQPDYAALDAADAARSANPPPPYQYRYKDEFAAKQGTDTESRLGIMAQDALKSPMYKPAVVKMKDGMLGIDSNRLLHANTAMLSGEHERINQVESQNQKLAEALARMGAQKENEIRGDDLGDALMRMGNQRSREVRDF